MASLAVAGEPDAWLDIGYAVSTLATLLEAELSDADALGAQALARSWYGPAASSFSVDWASRRGRYEELIDLARRAGRLITEYGDALREAQEHSRAIEYLWCASGLIVSPAGIFALPEAVSLLPSPARMTLEHALAGAERDVVSLEAEVAAGVAALAFGLNPVIMLLEEFALLAAGNADVREFAREFMPGLSPRAFLPGVLLGDVPDVARDIAEDIKDVPAATCVTDLADVGDHVLTVATWTDVGWDVWHDARHEGYLGSFEQNAGNIASAAVGGVATATVGTLVAGVLLAGAPAIVVTVGAAVVGGVVALGVGTVVQMVVNDNKTTINRDVHDIGRDADEIGDGIGDEVEQDLGAQVPPGVENLIGPAPAY